MLDPPPSHADQRGTETLRQTERDVLAPVALGRPAGTLFIVIDTLTRPHFATLSSLQPAFSPTRSPRLLATCGRGDLPSPARGR